ncbi:MULTISPECIES: VOC family protein [unclassified Lysobacter]|uniref:VOC family protein n=1 Tax=unclassified Lysobacter TaxID=2635362 RepID=UPI0006F77EBC|nr:MULTISPECIES: VOC family protein [unclassified Lysobacter]KQZ66262.1 lactoylglutathione lyase [Lysobacter sp. Root559]KRA73169.1 lactoylglutathione lyase [Lysobacter sp. Root667]KRC32259.1 lactoylglutathione lyase [Lysobacter sp. Root76]KRD68023.1 lactoylglutathione lyase [Lysobacter sp. Root96]
MSAPPFQLLQLDHIVLRVRDPEAMVAFYCDVLGCSVERRQDEIGLIQLRAGQSLIDLVGVDGKLGRMGGAAPGAEGRNMDHLCLRADPFDRDAILAHLHAHEVRVGDFGSRYGAQGEGPSQYLFDPEGNLVELKGPPDPLPAATATNG